MGSILLDGQQLERISRQEVARQIGYVPQSSSTPLDTTVFDTVLIGRRPHIVAGVLERLHLADQAMRDFSQLSIGQKQKMLIGRALAQKTAVLLLDEPTSNLDMLLPAGSDGNGGKPKALFSKVNIIQVYGIEAMVMNALGRPYIVPLRSLCSG